MTNFKGFIQIAGVLDKEDAETIIEAGVKYIGFPLGLDVNLPDLSEAEAREIIAGFPPKAEGVLITYLSHSRELKKLIEFLGVKIVQIHGDISLEEIIKLRKSLPNIKIIKSLVIKNNNFEELSELIGILQPVTDAFITDTFDPVTGASGATGKTHDWKISRKIVEFSLKPVILAGGLNPENVSDAIRFVRPAGVDSHTGVENPEGRKDKSLLQEFVENANAAFEIPNKGFFT